MDTLPEFVGTVHIFLGPYRGNPIALYMKRDAENCHISPRMYPWSQTVGIGENPNKAAADFEAKWKENDLSAEMYSGPHWEGGIKPEKPKPPPKPAAAPPKPDASTAAATTSPVPAAPAQASSPAPAAPSAQPAPPASDSAASAPAASPAPAPPPPKSESATDPPASTTQEVSS